LTDASFTCRSLPGRPNERSAGRVEEDPAPKRKDPGRVEEDPAPNNHVNLVILNVPFFLLHQSLSNN